MAQPKVRILADVTVEKKDQLEEVIKVLGITRREFFEMAIEEYYGKYVNPSQQQETNRNER